MNTRQTIVIISKGLVMCVAYALLTTSVALVVGMALTLAGNAGWIHLGEYQPWLPIIGVECGLPAGLIVGAIVCWRRCMKQLRPHTETEAADWPAV